MHQDLDHFIKSFSNITPNAEQIVRIEYVRESYKNTLSIMWDSTFATPERTISVRKMEESLMYAVKAIVMENV